jgi:hypothetical protein
MAVSRGSNRSPYDPDRQQRQYRQTIENQLAVVSEFRFELHECAPVSVHTEHFASAALPDAADKRAGWRSIVANDGSVKTGLLCATHRL